MGGDLEVTLVREADATEKEERVRDRKRTGRQGWGGGGGNTAKSRKKVSTVSEKGTAEIPGGREGLSQRPEWRGGSRGSG